MASFVAPLLAGGYRVVWFDQPGHGESGRGPVALPDFVRALDALAATHGPFKAAIGHSLGAAALGLAMRRGMQLDRIVFVSPPASISEHAHKFARLLGITPKIRDAMRRRLEQRYGVRFAEIDRLDELSQLHPACIVRARQRRRRRSVRANAAVVGAHARGAADQDLWPRPLPASA
jgi:pimeloyl-ACP methyl ester carboxylesterase